jgi:hypothetical protein
MDEDIYRATYHELNKRRCIFEKAINSRVCACKKSRQFNLADREGVACTSPAGQMMCKQLVDQFRRNARFSLGLTRVEGPLPHAREIKVQNGGLLGLQKLIVEKHDASKDLDRIDNIYGLVAQAIHRYGDLDRLPFNEIVKSVVSYGRRRKRSRRRD